MVLRNLFANFRKTISCIKGLDVIAQAQSAKNLAIAFQIQKVVIALGDYMSAQCHACIGGTNVREDIRKLEMGVHVVVGTPGRVYDMISRKALRWKKGVPFLGRKG
ncbi:Eukaryotic initiation factor 4A like protein [Argiope bruennichi]|uniref:Eukaryotic initiation factor 4A like protein n=1 Tax=Argiope bruennichi TaxID=94029 RepID=A0A8T0FCJ5_ARGBR|nr:Eukaryotic initiation factor 4A like protein [Argiope bruennichi]